MRELFLVVGLVLLLVGAAGLWLVPWTELLVFGIIVTAAGFVLSVPMGVVYHVQLYRCLSPRGALPRRWIWGPIALNARLLREERIRVMPWCYAGAAGFGVIVLGQLLVLAASMMSLASR
ncbi:MAG: hypothetical protein MUC50_07185 [Myxococcota bacterium]|jgi:hypothetical protein|nr:hypothetical protein [Myxococcota bacterium]